ncbi:MAG: ABC transporter substrate-binding protein [Alphaproteobacteria bacterium]|nr:ABC transporter substrate-binding protein [Alphaproteobacteria bacterium]
MRNIATTHRTLPRRTLIGATAATLAAPSILGAQGKTTVEFYFPVAVGGPITKIIDGYCTEFMAANTDIEVKPIYAGSYVDTLTKAITATKAGQGPQMALVLAVDAYTLIDDELILPFDTLATSDADKAWLKSFYPAFMANGTIDGHVWGIPFQRSTIVAYWNKEIFKEIGLDPEKGPASWAENAEWTAKATKREGDKVSRWGIQIPGDGFTYWLYQAMAAQAGVELAGDNGRRTDFNSAGAVEGLQFWLDLMNKHRSHPTGISAWGTGPRDFLEGTTAVIWHTTGNLTNIKNNAKFPFGVAMLPAGKRRGSPAGGGNFHLFKGATPAQQQASLRFLRWLTSPEKAAAWGMATGYVATRPDAWETPTMKDYVAGFPQAAVARDQLAFAVPELSTHDNQRVAKALTDELQAALLGRKPPKQALDDAQAAATRLLKPYQKA